MNKIIFVLVLPCLFLFMLGIWQLFRLKWKHDIVKNMELPVVRLAPDANIEQFNYRHVEVDGILSDLELYVFKGGQNEYYTLSPMLLASGSYMLVYQGTRGNREAKIEKVTISGVIYCDSSKSKFIKNDPNNNIWFTLNPEEISHDINIKLEKCMLWQTDFDNKFAIQPVKHLEYAITWFALSISWLVIFIYSLQ